jgi:hypothetical protein
MIGTMTAREIALAVSVKRKSLVAWALHHRIRLRKPTHRYSDAMVAKLRDMCARGFPATAVAAELSKMSKHPVTALSVRAKACSLGLRFRRDARYRTEVRCMVGLDTWERLRNLALARGLSVSQLAQLFIEIAVDERLIGKIIDDRRPRSRKRRSADAPRIGRPRRDDHEQGVPKG